MSLQTEVIDVSTIQVEIVRKNIKSMRIGVFPPSGRVRVSVPLSYELHLIESVLLRKMTWIRRQQDAFQKQERQSPREAVSGETYYFKGNRYKLNVVDGRTRGHLRIRNSRCMELSISPASTLTSRLLVIERFYRKALMEELKILIDRNSKMLDIDNVEFSIRKMNNRWGSCNAITKKISFNLELIKKNPQCINYIVIHELVHILEPSHNDNFKELMDKHLPNWRNIRDLLNTAPLAHANWDY